MTCIFLLILCLTFLSVSGVEWCTTKPLQGLFTVSVSPCTVTQTVKVLNGTLDLTGDDQTGTKAIIQRDLSSPKFRLFEVRNTATLILRNLHLKNGNVNIDGSDWKTIMYTDQECKHCGGGVFVSGSNAIFRSLNTNYEENHAFLGGHIYAENMATVIIDGSTLNECENGVNPMLDEPNMHKAPAGDNGECATIGSSMACRAVIHSCRVQNTIVQGSSTCPCEGMRSITNETERSMRSSECFEGKDQECRKRL